MTVALVANIARPISSAISTASSADNYGKLNAYGILGPTEPAAPVNVSAPVVFGHDSDGSTLTSTRGSWTGYPYPTYSYQWKSDAANVGTDQNTYVTQAGDIGKSITCVVTATNTEGSADQASNGITVTESAAPANTVAPVVSGSQPAGSTMTTTNGTWTANPAVDTYAYQWKADATNVGTNQATYVTQVADVGKSITCTVTATNRKGSTAHASNGITVTAALAAPANTVAPAISGDTGDGSTLTSTTGTWIGNPTPTYAYQWKADSTNVGSNQNTYVTQAGDVGKSVTCTVTATNSQGNSSQASNGITVTESDPDAVITALFASGEQGAWYDPSDLSTMFQNRAGTTPVTADGQTVGLILDKSKGLVLGSELVDTANTAAAWTPYDSNTVTQDGGAIKITYVGGGAAPYGAYLFLNAAGGLSSDPVAGKGYVLSCNVRVNSGSSVTVATKVNSVNYPSAPITSTTNTKISFTFVYETGALQFECDGTLGAGEEIWFSDISVKEIQGNHAVALSDAARPLKTSTGLSDWINYDAVDDVLNITFQSSLGSSCTVCRANVGAAPTILTAQTIGTSYADSTDYAGLIIINRAMTGQETTDVTAWLLAKGATA